MKLEHEDGEDYGAKTGQVTVHYDAQRENLEVNEKGQVEVDNELQAKELQDSNGSFEVVEGDESDLPDHVLADKNVDEVEEYVREMIDLERLKELREKEDRKTAIQHIDSRIEEVKQNQPTEPEFEEVEENQEEEENEEDNQENGEETEE